MAVDVSSGAAGWPATVVQVVAGRDDLFSRRPVLDVVDSLTAHRGRSVIVSAGGRWPDAAANAGAGHVTLPLASANPLTQWRLGERIAEVVRADAARILHLRDRQPAVAAAEAARRAGCAFVVSADRPWDGRGLLDRRANAALLQAERVIVPTAFMQSWIERRDPALCDRVRLIRHGIPAWRLDPAAISNARLIQAARRLNLDEATRVVLVPIKLPIAGAIDTLLDAIARLGTSDLRCVLVGWDAESTSERRALDGAIADRSLDGVVQVVPDLPDPHAIFRLADVVALPAMSVPTAHRAALEAQALARPVIAADEEGAGEHVLARQTGWLFPVGDSDALGAAIDEALRLDAAGRYNLGAAAVHHVTMGFDPGASAEQVVALYREVVAAAFAPAS